MYLHFRARRDAAKGGPRKAHHRQASVVEGRVQALLEEQTRVGQLPGQVFVRDAPRRPGHGLVRVGGVQKDGEGVAVARASDDHVTGELGAVVENRAALRGRRGGGKKNACQW